VGDAPAAMRAARQPAPRPAAPAVASVPESEPNNRFEDADSIDPAAGPLTVLGAITNPADQGGDRGDWFTFNVPPGQGGATVHITLTDLPADYDVALLASPK